MCHIFKSLDISIFIVFDSCDIQDLKDIDTSGVTGMLTKSTNCISTKSKSTKCRSFGNPLKLNV